MTTQNLRALVALDLDTSSVLNRAWAKGLLSFFHSGGVSIDFLSRNPELGDFEENIAPLCESVIPAHLHVDADSMDRHGVSCLLYTSPSPRDATLSRMPSSA